MHPMFGRNKGPSLPPMPWPSKNKFINSTKSILLIQLLSHPRYLVMSLLTTNKASFVFVPIYVILIGLVPKTITVHFLSIKSLVLVLFIQSYLLWMDFPTIIKSKSSHKINMRPPLLSTLGIFAYCVMSFALKMFVSITNVPCHIFFHDFVHHYPWLSQLSHYSFKRGKVICWLGSATYPRCKIGISTNSFFLYDTVWYVIHEASEWALVERTMTLFIGKGIFAPWPWNRRNFKEGMRNTKGNTIIL
jgi:hypothetical protein